MEAIQARPAFTPDEDTNKMTRIAVIDDERKWLNVFTRMFKDSPYLIDTYDDPQAFLRILADQPNRYAGIICDIQMPRMDGHQVYQAVKDRRETSKIPFLIVSGVLTRNHNLSKVEGLAYVSKLNDDLRSKVFEELIEVIENWPIVKNHLRSRNVSEDKINFFCQFFINYHKYFNEILAYVNKMETACVAADETAIARISGQCDQYMSDLHETWMELMSLVQQSSAASRFIQRVCKRGHTSLNMVRTFQLLLTEDPSSEGEFRLFLQDCRDNLEKIIVGTEKGYNLRNQV